MELRFSTFIYFDFTDESPFALLSRVWFALGFWRLVDASLGLKAVDWEDRI